jgi:putative acetyltransferase
MTNTVVIVPLDPADTSHREAFLNLNIAWISRYFQIEPHDEDQLREPESHILASGGQVWLAITEENEIVGTCALITTAPGEYELAKMSVADHCQGQGVGKRLCETAVDWARTAGAQRLWLESNRKLTPALRLYEKAGFREVPLVPSPYARADIRMELVFPQQP